MIMRIVELLFTVLCGVLIGWIIASLKQKLSREGIPSQEQNPSQKKSLHEQNSSLPSPALPTVTEKTTACTKLDSKPVVFRVRGQFSSSDLPGLLERYFGAHCKPYIHSLAVQADKEESIATVTFDTVPAQLLDSDEKTFKDENITIDRHFHGLSVLFSPETSNHQLDIIAVCGLGGHAFGSFKERDGVHMWLRDSLPRDIPYARIITYGYDSHIYGSNSFQNFESLASSLRISVEGIKPPPNALREKPVIFIAHSLGGLILKQALIQSGLAKSKLQFYTQGALFFGVPNEGMHISSLIPMAEGQPNQTLSYNLQQESEVLRTQRRQFPEVFNSTTTSIFCFYETKTSPTAKKDIDNKWRMNGDPVILVGSNSATHCRPWETKAHHVQGLNRDHSGLVKFRARDDDYDKVRNILREMIKQDTPLKRRLTIPDKDEKLTSTCLQDLLLTNPDDEMLRIEMNKDKLLKECYQWVMNDRQFCEWRTDPSRRLLWLRGDPGKGKTMLMISLVRELRPSWNDAHALTFFFCQNSDAKLNTATAVLRGLLWSLIHEYPSLGCYLHADYKHGGKQLFEGSAAFFTLHRIMSELLQDSTLPTVYIVIDALDECDIGREYLLKFIRENAADERSKAKWLVSSRNHLDIENILRDDQHSMLSLELNATHIAKAVESFIDHKIDELATKKQYKESLRKIVRKHLMANANSTFLWVALVCKRLEGIANYKTAAELKNLPPGLSPLYGRMLEQLLEGEDSKLTTAIIMSIILAKRPLMLDEIHTLAGLPEEVMDDEQSLLDLVSLCGSFATIREGIIYLIHQSAKDYFISGEGQKVFTCGIIQEHRKIVDRSLYLMSKKLKKNMCSLDGPGAPANNDNPLLRSLGYVSCFWIDHLVDYQEACADIGEDNKSLSDQGTVHQFLLKYFLNWVELLALLGQLRAGISSFRRLEGMKKREAGMNLDSFVHDAVRFILQCYLAVEQAPLQIYTSGLIFAPEESLVRQTFVQDIPSWIHQFPRMPRKWSALQQTLEGHTSTVWSVVFSPDGKQLVSGSEDSKIRLWDTATGALQQVLKGHTSLVYSVAYSPNSKRLASGSSDNTVRLWDTTTGALQQTLEGHTSSVYSVAYSPDGKQLASGSDDNIVQLWDIATGTLQQTLEGHTSSVWSVVFSPDGKQLAIGSGDKVRLWDTATSALQQTLEGHTSSVRSVAFSPDGKRLASGSVDDTVRLWDITTGALQQTLKGHTSSVYSVAYSPDGKRLASGSNDNTVRLWDTTTSALQQTLEGHTSVRSVAFSPDSKRLVSGSSDNTVQLWDIATSALQQPLEGHTSTVRSVVFSPDGKRLASGSDDNTVQLWDTATSALQQTLKGHTSFVLTAAFSLDGKQLVSGSSDNTVRLWDITTGALQQTLEGHASAVWSVAFSPDGKRLASGSGDTVRLWDTATGALQQTLEGHTSWVWSVIFSLDGKRLASGSGDTVRLWDIATGALQQTLNNITPFQSLDFLFNSQNTPDSTKLSLNGDKSWISWNGNRLIWLPPSFRPGDSVVHGNRIAIGCHSGLVYILELNVGALSIN